VIDPYSQRMMPGSGYRSDPTGVSSLFDLQKIDLFLIDFVHSESWQPIRSKNDFIVE